MESLIKYIILGLCDSPLNAHDLAKWINSREEFNGYNITPKIIQEEIEKYWKDGGNAIRSYENLEYPDLYLDIDEAEEEFPDLFKCAEHLHT